MVVLAFSYIRFSSASQRGNDSLRRQRKASAALAERKGWIMDNKLQFEDEACSAFKSKNANVGRLGEFLAAVESGAVPAGSVLIVESLDRLSRDKIGVALQLFLRILGAGVSICTVEPETLYTPDAANDVAALMLALVGMYRAHEESKLKSERVGAAWDSKRSKAKEEGKKMSKVRPRWIDLDEHGEFQLNPVHGRTVAKIVDWCREGKGCNTIVRLLDADPDNYPCFTRTGRWCVESIRLIILRPNVWGGILLDGETEPIPGYYPPVVDRPIAEEAVSSLLSRRNHGGRPGKKETCLFTHLLWHASSKTRMYVRTVTSHASLRRDLVAAVAGKNAKIADGTSTQHQRFEDAVLGMLDELTATDVQPPSPDDSQDEKAVHERAKGELAEARKRVADLQRRMADSSEAQDIVDALLPAFRMAVERVKLCEQKEAQAGIAAVKATDASLEKTQSAVRAMRNANPEELPEMRRRAKAAIASLVESIWVYMAPASPEQQAVHVQVFFRDGGKRCLVIPPRKPGDGVLVPNLDSFDFREGYPPTKTTSKPAPKRRASRSRS